jgi:hypothetical protein
MKNDGFMPVEIAREGNVCERCNVLAGENNQKLEHFKNYGIDELLCRDCREQIERENCKECPECKEELTPQNQLHQYRIATKKFPYGEDFKHCSNCKLKRIKKISTRYKTTHFIKSNWDKWIFITLAIMGLIGISSWISNIQP